jgi:hypothetical protein
MFFAPSKKAEKLLLGRRRRAGAQRRSEQKRATIKGPDRAWVCGAGRAASIWRYVGQIIFDFSFFDEEAN